MTESSFQQLADKNEELLSTLKRRQHYVAIPGLTIAFVGFIFILLGSLWPLKPEAGLTAYVSIIGGVFFLLVFVFSAFALIVAPLFHWYRLTGEVRQVKRVLGTLRDARDVQSQLEEGLTSANSSAAQLLQRESFDVNALKSLRGMYHRLRQTRDELEVHMSKLREEDGTDVLKELERHYKLLLKLRAQTRDQLSTSLIPLFVLFVLTIIQTSYLFFGLYLLRPDDFSPEKPTRTFDFLYSSFLIMTNQSVPNWSGFLPKLVILVSSSFGLFMIIMFASLGLTIFTTGLADED